jgi:chromosome segregation ATPase
MKFNREGEKMKTNEIIKTLRYFSVGHKETDGIPTEVLILAANRLQELEASTLHIIRQAAEAQDERDEYIMQCGDLIDKLEIASNNSAKFQSKYDEAAANVQRLKKALDESDQGLEQLGEKNRNLNTIHDIKDFFSAQSNVPKPVREDKARIVESLAKEILLRNETIYIDGTVNGFKLRSIGLGVYEIKLNILKTTELLKD